MKCWRQDGQWVFSEPLPAHGIINLPDLTYMCACGEWDPRWLDSRDVFAAHCITSELEDR